MYQQISNQVGATSESPLLYVFSFPHQVLVDSRKIGQHYYADGLGKVALGGIRLRYLLFFSRKAASASLRTSFLIRMILISVTCSTACPSE
jgi:hypothetical protein